jgi:hypothetical protein
MKFYFIMFGLHSMLGGPYADLATCNKELVKQVHDLGVDPGFYGAAARNAGFCLQGYDFKDSIDKIKP